VKPDWLDEKAWVESGLGVDGDSHAWIIDRSTTQFYRMLWERQGEGAEMVMYFTTMAEIFANMKEKLREADVLEEEEKIKKGEVLYLSHFDFKASSHWYGLL
jgi:hypothetical protein